MADRNRKGCTHIFPAEICTSGKIEVIRTLYTDAMGKQGEQEHQIKVEGFSFSGTGKKIVDQD